MTWLSKCWPLVPQPAVACFGPDHRVLVVKLFAIQVRAGKLAKITQFPYAISFVSVFLKGVVAESFLIQWLNY